MIGHVFRKFERRISGRLRNRAGLSLVELIVAMMVLTIGLLGMAAGTGWMIRAVDLAQIETARGAALQSAVEDIRGKPWSDLEDGQATFGDFTIRWTMVAPGLESRLYRFEVAGPGRGAGVSRGIPAIAPDVTSSLDYRINRR